MKGRRIFEQALIVGRLPAFVSSFYSGRELSRTQAHLKHI